jgi:5-methyltetrahydropteroyltriglutamate--homocysteine methyltransferase
MSGSAQSAPPFHAEHIGSLLRPDELRRAFRDLSKGEITAEKFHSVQEQCIRDVVKMQEDVGLQLVTDGEFRRTTYISHFVESVDGLDFGPSSFRFYDAVGGEHEFVGPQCVGKVKRVKSNSGEEFDFLKTLTNQTPKMTLPSPATMHFLGGANQPPAEAYADVEEFFSDLALAYEEDIADLAARGARYIQIDDVPFPMLCDPALRGQLEQRGIDPEILLDQYIELTNAAVRNRPADVTAAIHLCRGNLKGTWLSEGGYDAVAKKLFQKLEVDAFFLEYDTERAGGFEPLAEMPDDKFVVLGLISSKLPEMENTEAVKARIQAASKYIALDRLGLSPQCGFSSAVAGNPVTIDDQKAKLRMVVNIAADIWG